MSDIWQDIHYAWRSLRRMSGFAMMVILILTIGIGANVAIFSLLHAVLIRPLPYPEPDRLVLGRATMNGRINPFVSALDYWDYRELSTSFDSLAAFSPFDRGFTVTGLREPERVSGFVVSHELFPALGVEPMIGRRFVADDEGRDAPLVVIVSHGYWQRRFGGSPYVIGRTLIIDGLPRELIGVLPAGFRFFDDVDLWSPMLADDPFIAQRWNHNWLIAGRLKAGRTIEEAQSELDVISAQLEAQYPDSNRGKALLLTHLQEALVEGHDRSLLLLMAAVALVLLVACSNAAGLLLARGSVRRIELSVRTVLGASGRRLVRQLLTESLVLAASAGILGTLLAQWIQTLALELLPVRLAGGAQVGLSSLVLSFAVGISLITGLLFGIVPALRATRFDVAEDLKTGGRITDAGGSRFRSVLVIAQVALSVVLVVGAGLLIRSFMRLTNVDPGFDTQNLLTAEISLPYSKYSDRQRRVRFFTDLVERVNALPGVTGVALVNRLPIRDQGGNDELVHPAQNPPTEPGQRRSSYLRIVLPSYFETMEIPLLAGRAIERTDVRGSPLVIVISRNMADEFFPGQDPIGQQLVVDPDDPHTFEVVGVVGDVRMSALGSKPWRAMYLSYLQAPYTTMRIAVRTEVRPESVAGALREAVWSQDSDIPVAGLATMEQAVARTTAGQKVQAAALSLFGGTALLLAAVGLYGVLAYYVGERRHEIGVRVALGASPSNVLKMILRRGITLVIVGLALGLLGALAATRLLEEMLYELDPTDPATFVLVCAVFAVVAVFACLLPARRALGVDPMLALQTE